MLRFVYLAVCVNFVCDEVCLCKVLLECDEQPFELPRDYENQILARSSFSNQYALFVCVIILQTIKTVWGEGGGTRNWFYGL